MSNSINFNGDVTVHGTMEIYNNSNVVKNPPTEVHVLQLKQFIAQTLPNSTEKTNYMTAADVLSQSTDVNAIQGALSKIKKFVAESGKDIIIQGLSTFVADIAAKMLIK